MAEESETSLESLPREMHKRTISFLPVRDAVRTSAISHAWRRLWESAPDLAHDWDYNADPAHADAVLRRYSCPMSNFFFDLPEASFHYADDWIPLLASKGVQRLTFHFSQDNDDGDPYYMNMFIFLCRKLTYLSLIGCDIPASQVGLAGFPNLVKLYLEGVGFPDNGVRGLEALIAESPLLQLLCLENLRFPEDELEEWVIRAPNLQELIIVSEYDNGWLIVELPHIKRVDIHLDNYTNNRDFVKLLTRVAGVRELCLKMPDRASNVLEGLSCSFENLKTLSMKTDFCLLSTILSTMFLLKNAPNLEELSIQILYGSPQHEEVGVDLLNAQWTDGLLDRLKSVSLDMATCESNEMHFIEFVLSKARRLQEFHICAFECSRSNEEILVEILKYRRASPQAQVFFKPM